jgi:hypothetical protein
MDDLMSGEIIYYIQCFENEKGEMNPFIMIEKFSKETRPYCWKNCDLRVESTLPLLGNDMKNVPERIDSNKGCLAKVTVKLSNDDI